MTTSGWTGGDQDGAPAAAGGFAGFIGSMRGTPEDRPDALTRARLATDKPDEPYDQDERQANLMGRGYAAGHVSGLVQRYADKRAEQAAELEKIEKGEKVTARVRGMLERGQIGGLDAARMMDGDFGDPGRVAQLERQCKNLERQIGDAQALIAPAAERAPDQFASANRTAHELFTATTRQRRAEVQAGRPERPPFTGRGSVATMDAEPHFSGSLWNPGQEIRRGNLGAAAQETAIRASGRLEDLGYGQSSPGGCPPCSGCHYVICKCGDRVHA